MRWYIQRQMTWGLIVAYMMTYFILFTLIDSYPLNRALGACSAEATLICCTLVSALCCLSAADIPAKRKWLLLLAATLLYIGGICLCIYCAMRAISISYSLISAGLMLWLLGYLTAQRPGSSEHPLLSLYAGRVYPACLAATVVLLMLLMSLVLQSDTSSLFIMQIMGVIYWLATSTCMLLIMSVLENKSKQLITDRKKLHRYAMWGIALPVLPLMLVFGIETLVLIVPSTCAYLVSIIITRLLTAPKPGTH